MVREERKFDSFLQHQQKGKNMKNLQTLVMAFATLCFMTMNANAATDPVSSLFYGIFGGTSQPVTILHRGHRVRGVDPQQNNIGESHGGSVVRASYYGHGERLSRHTASGAVFNPYGFSAAHRSLPLGSHLLVSYGSRSVRVVVNDRGPAAFTGRSLDLSYGAARALGMGGTGLVRIARLD